MRLSITVILLSVAAIITTTSAKKPELEKCSVNSVPTKCPKSYYCLASESSHSYCAKQLDGGKECSKDEACKSGICFIAKHRGAKRVCALAPLSNYSLGAQCTESRQCKSQFCSSGYCKKPVGAGENCPKEAGCAELKLGAHCLKKPATFIVYDSAGKRKTKNLSAGKCSYVTNLGEGMKCSSTSNCYAKGFTCSKDTHTCIAISKPPPSKLPYNEACSTDASCLSDTCLENKCGCAAGSSDCGSLAYCNMGVCQPKRKYDALCDDSEECLDNLCVDPRAGRRSPLPFYKSCGCVDSGPCKSTQYCDTTGTHMCMAKLSPSDPCYTGSQCRSGVCQITAGSTGQCGCALNTDCSGSDICDTTQQSCVPGPTNLSYQEDCSADEQCASGICSNGKCGCNGVSENECDPHLMKGQTGHYCSNDHLCVARQPYGSDCITEGAKSCASRVCVSPDAQSTGQICGCRQNQAPYCADDEYCDDPSSNLCMKKHGYVGECSWNGMCSSGLCDLDSMTCS